MNEAMDKTNVGNKSVGIKSKIRRRTSLFKFKKKKKV